MLQNHVFISYSHKDKRWLEVLENCLKPGLRGSSIGAWYDGKINPGDDWEKEIKHALASTKVAVLLVSYHYLASDFIMDEELPYLLKAADEKKITLIPVLVRRCLWKNTLLRSIEWANDPDRPLSILSPPAKEKKLIEICELIASHANSENPSPDHTAAGPHANADKGREQSSVEGIKILMELMCVPGVTERAEASEMVFNASSKQLDILTSYKELHDVLHDLQIKYNYYRTNIVEKAESDPDDMSVWANAGAYELDGRDVAGDLDEAVQHYFQERTPPDWIEKLKQCLEGLALGVRGKDIQKVTSALRPIQRVLSAELPRINRDLVAAARVLQLPGLIKTQTTIRDSLDGKGVNAVRMQRLDNGIQGVERLDRRLGSLIARHDTWQHVDETLRLIEGTLSESTSDLESLWDEVKAKIETLCNNYDERLAEPLRNDIARLDRALTANERVTLKEYFQEFRSNTNRCFFDVDKTLRKLCRELRTEMRNIRHPLIDVLEVAK